MYQILKPESLSSAQLDNYLSKGWYRAGQVIFTLDKFDFTDNAGNLFFRDKVYWIRIVLGQFRYSRSQKKILRTNEAYTTEIADYRITEELEDLFMQYRLTIDFDHTSNVYDFLHLDSANNIFDTKLITVKDGDKLIAAGYFDAAENSIAGILNFYDPLYSKLSLGKFLMLKKIEYAKANGKAFYYLGYIAKLYSKFQYKLLQPAATEVYNFKTQTWQPFDEFQFT